MASYNTYIWKHKADDGVTELYAGRTNLSVDRRIKLNGWAYVGPNSRPIAGGAVEVIHQDTLQFDDDIKKYYREEDICSAEQLLIDTIKAIKQLYPDKVRVLNSRRGFSASACYWKKVRHEEYKNENSEGLEFVPKLLSKIIKSL